MHYLRPLVGLGPRLPGALSLAGTPVWFDRVERLDREGGREVLSLSDLTPQQRDRFSAPRQPVMGLTLDRPRVLGVLNLAPNSTYGGDHQADSGAAIALARGLIAQGADALELVVDRNTTDTESDRAREQLDRLTPTLDQLRDMRGSVPLIVSTRKARVADAAIRAGASGISDTTAMAHDPDMLPVLADSVVPLVLVHIGGAGRDIVFDTYDRFAALLAVTDELNVLRERILLDVGLNLGKGIDETLMLIRHLPMFHGLGCPLMISPSRKPFIGALTGEMLQARRTAGALAVSLDGLRSGVHLIRTHDVLPHRQSIAVWRALAEV